MPPLALEVVPFGRSQATGGHLTLDLSFVMVDAVHELAGVERVEPHRDGHRRAAEQDVEPTHVHARKIGVEALDLHEVLIGPDAVPFLRQGGRDGVYQHCIANGFRGFLPPQRWRAHRHDRFEAVRP